MFNLIEAEALGGVRQDVRVNRVRGVRSPVRDRAFLRGQGLEDATQETNMERRQCFNSLILSSSKSPDFGQAERVKATARGDVTGNESVVKRVRRDASSVRFAPPTKTVSMAKTAQKDG